MKWKNIKKTERRKIKKVTKCGMQLYKGIRGG
jgi:hypothetical protein